MDSGHQKLRDFIETLTQQECDELYKMLKTLLEEEVVFIAGPPEPLAEDDYEVMPLKDFTGIVKALEAEQKRRKEAKSAAPA
jgi:hypothetical protein